MLETTRKHKFTKALSAAFPHTLPVLAGFLVLGIAYGMLMLEKGYGPQWSVLMSAVAFCGSMQFVAITLLTTAFQPLEALILSLLVNARHLFYGLSMLDNPGSKSLSRRKIVRAFTMSCAVSLMEQFCQPTAMKTGYCAQTTKFDRLSGETEFFAVRTERSPEFFPPESM